MKKFSKFLIVLPLLLTISCKIGQKAASNENSKPINENPDQTEDAEENTPVDLSGDLTFFVNTAQQGIGENFSSNDGSFIDCTASTVSLFPLLLNNALVAFGVSAPPISANCGSCRISYKCSPGENISLSYRAKNGSFSTPDDFEAGALGITHSQTITCPEEGANRGILTINDDIHTNYDYLKVTVSGIEGNDTEYLHCKNSGGGDLE